VNIPCPYCRSANTRPLSTPIITVVDNDDEFYAQQRCDDCGGVFIVHHTPAARIVVLTHPQQEGEGDD